MLCTNGRVLVGTPSPQRGGNRQHGCGYQPGGVNFVLSSGSSQSCFTAVTSKVHLPRGSEEPYVCKSLSFQEVRIMYLNV